MKKNRNKQENLEVHSSKTVPSVTNPDDSWWKSETRAKLGLEVLRFSRLNGNHVNLADEVVLTSIIYCRCHIFVTLTP